MDRKCYVDIFVSCDHFDSMNILAPFGPKTKNVSFWRPLVAKGYSFGTAIIVILNAHDIPTN